LWLVLLGLAFVLAGTSDAAEFHLIDGTDLSGEVASATDQGLVIRLKVGGFSERISWAKLTQETLKELAKDPKTTAGFVEPYIDVPPEEKAKAKRKEIEIKPVPRPPRLEGRISLFAALNTPIGLLVLFIFLVANIYAGFEIAVFRHQPIVLSCVVSAFVPVVGPLIFLALPPREATEHAPDVAAMSADQFASAHPSAEAATPMESPASLTSRMKKKITSMFQSKPEGGLSLAAHQKPAAPKGALEPRLFRRGDTTFNRRFFETQFAPYFRVVLSEAEKTMVIAVKAGKNEYVGRRISRISGNEIGLQLQSGGEVQVDFADIHEVQLRPKEA
jgi:hypothetical protein